MWDPFQSFLAAAVVGGIDRFCVAPGQSVLFLGSPSPATVMALADIVGPVSPEAAYIFARCGMRWAAEPRMRCTSGVDFGGVSGKSRRGWEPHPLSIRSGFGRREQCALH